MRTALGVTYLVTFIIAISFFIAANVIGSGLFCNGHCAFEQTEWTITQEIGLGILLIAAIAGFVSKRATSVLKDSLLVAAVIPFAAVVWFLFVFLSVAVLGQNSPFY